MALNSWSVREHVATAFATCIVDARRTSHESPSYYCQALLVKLLSCVSTPHKLPGFGGSPAQQMALH